MAQVSNSALSSQQIPDWLRITKIAEGHYRVTDTSVEAVGLYLGSFPTQHAAKRFAMKVSEARAETRARNLQQMRSRRAAGSSSSPSMGM